MSCPNFKSMDEFPLIVADNMTGKLCECGCMNAEDAETCEMCGASLEDVEASYDEIGMEVLATDMETWADRMNDELRFYKVSVESGYYVGLQFYVTTTCGGGYDSPEDMDNEDTQYYYGKCRSQILREFYAEQKRIVKMLRRAKEELGLDEIVCVDIFSNGEAIYEKVA